MVARKFGLKIPGLGKKPKVPGLGGGLKPKLPSLPKGTLGKVKGSLKSPSLNTSKLTGSLPKAPSGKTPFSYKPQGPSVSNKVPKSPVGGAVKVGPGSAGATQIKKKKVGY